MAGALGVVLAIALGAGAGVLMLRAADEGSGGGSADSFPLAGKVLPAPTGDIYWGVYVPGAPYRRDLLDRVEHLAGHRPAILMWYQQWFRQPAFPAADAAWLYRQGIVPMIAWEPWKPMEGPGAVDQPRYRLSRIVAGAFDQYITQYARDVRRYGGPVMLRPLHEMNGNWYPWGGTVNGNTPAEYVAAWRHIYDLFQQAGASNVTWVWSPNHFSIPGTRENEITNYWPGSRYVDWIGLSAFNWGTSTDFGRWKPFDLMIHRSAYLALSAYDKPILLAETGSAEVGGDKAAWILDSFATAQASYSALRAIIWYDRKDSTLQDWRIDSSPAALDAFRRAISDRRVLSADAAHATAAASPAG
jgi:hypothetical protein